MHRIQAFLPSLILFLMAGTVAQLLLTGKAALYVHPRTNIFLAASAAAMLLIGLYSLRSALAASHHHEHEDLHGNGTQHGDCDAHHDQEEPHHHHDHCGCGHAHHPGFFTCLPFLVVLALLFLPAHGLDGKARAARSAENYLTTAKSSKADARIAAIRTHAVIDMTDDIFLPLSSDIMQEPANYAGKTLRLKGFAVKSKLAPADATGISRYFVHCCTADALLFSLQCREEKGHFEPKEGQWYAIEGVIEAYEKDGRLRPILSVIQAEEIPMPESPYIFP